MAPSYIAAIVGILSIFFPDIEIDALNTTVNTIVTIGSLLVVAARQIHTGRSTLAGTRPYED